MGRLAAALGVAIAEVDQFHEDDPSALLPR